MRDVEVSARFQAEVFGAEIVYWEQHFAVMRLAGSVWMLHSDWSYRDHEFVSAIQDLPARGGGIELRLYGVDPDVAEERARKRGMIVLSASIDKPHGLREVHILDADGYVFVPSMATSQG